MPRVLLDAYGLSDAVHQQLQTIDPTLQIVRGKRGEPIPDSTLASVEIIIGWPSADELAAAKSLKWLQLPSAGADNYAGKMPPDVILTCANGVFGVQIAEHILAMMFALSIRLPQLVLNQAQAKWQRVDGRRELGGATCLVVGLGDIGSELAKRAKALGMHVIGVKRTISGVPGYVDELATIGALDTLLPRADHVVLALPGTVHTRHVISRSRLARMKQGACIYNVGRGSAIDEQALVDALQSGRLAGAGLDVFDPEPLPADSPLWSMPNVIVTPHCSGISPQQPDRFASLLSRNLRHYLNREPLQNLVDSQWGY